jgi:hypothetical protein
MTPRPLPLLLRLLAVVGAAGALVLGAAMSPAAAHDGVAIIDIEGVHPAGTSIHYVVRVTWEDDGHAAVGATVTATATNAAGTQLTPVTLAPIDEDGRYGGVIDYPSEGTWTVRVTSIDPTGSEEQAQEVTASAATAPEDGPTEGDGATDDATDGVADGFAPADDGTGPDAEQAASDGSDDGGLPVYLIVAAAVVALVGAATAVGIIRRRSGAGPDGPAGTAGPDGPVDDTPPAEGEAGPGAIDDPPSSTAGTRPPAES